jgi:hypothetical protein
MQGRRGAREARDTKGGEFCKGDVSEGRCEGGKVQGRGARDKVRGRRGAREARCKGGEVQGRRGAR